MAVPSLCPECAGVTSWLSLCTENERGALETGRPVSFNSLSSQRYFSRFSSNHFRQPSMAAVRRASGYQALYPPSRPVRTLRLYEA